MEVYFITLFKNFSFLDEKEEGFSLNKVEWKILKKFIHEVLEPNAVSSKWRYYYCLNRFGKFINYNDDFSKSDVLAYFYSPYFQGLSFYTQKGIKICLKRFLKWLNRDYQYIKYKSKKKQESKLDDLPTWDEIREVIMKLRRPIDIAIFMLFLESGGTKGEIYRLNIGDIIFKGNFASVFFKETHLSQRFVPLVESVPFLVKYLETHPFRDDPHAPLFISLFKGKYRRLSYQSLYVIIKRNTKCLSNNIYPELLRQMRLKQLAKFVMPPLFEKIAGFVKESEMTQYYYHVTHKDAIEKVLELYEVEWQPEKDHAQIIGIKECPLCQHINSGIDSFCRKCGSVIERSIKTNMNNTRKRGEMYYFSKNSKRFRRGRAKVYKR